MNITDEMVQRATRVHNLRCTHVLRESRVREMLEAALDPDYTPQDEALRAPLGGRLSP